MLRGWRSYYLDCLSGTAHLALLAVAVQSGDSRVWMACLALAAGVSFIAWAGNYKRMRAIADLPTSRIASAAQGYVELYGRAIADPEHLIVSPFTSLRCVWYRFQVFQRRDGRHWRLVHEGASHETFVITDGSGQCFIDPDHAEVVGQERRVSYAADYKRVEEILFAGSIYALGEFATVGGANMPLNQKEDVAALLAEWKRDKDGLLKRFDLDGNGEIDLKEWELARRAAAREVEKQHRELRTAPGVHVMRAPADGRLFLLSSRSPQRLRRQYLLLSYIHGLVFIIILLALVRLSAGW
ncbi:hypothetical protein LG198_05060 [Methylobacillus arboreus]|uniref:hypothetical protein n=1 Tax=Methylobacillus arboreus TaxID=755170 RepID=UPI001E417DEA|nr:hypothetical protein [Methylobacillus arboreus]MCB5190092.1 hypothetical protein [Methylobacillus arboreus]